MNIEYAFLCKTPIFFKKKNKSLDLIELNKDLILKKYKELLDDLNKKEIKFESEYNENVKFFESKKCKCGSNLNFIKDFDFWGCSDYKNKEADHISFSGIEPKIFKDKISISGHWVALLIKDLGLKGKIQANILSNWFKNQGLEDLSEKCGYKPYGFFGYVETNKKSKEQEHKYLSIFNDFFNKVSYQQCIRYKLIGEEEKFCIPDFICGTDKIVFVIDCKLNSNSFDDDKSKLYLELVRFIINNLENKRDVVFLYATDCSLDEFNFEDYKIKYCSSLYDYIVDVEQFGLYSTSKELVKIKNKITENI